MAWSYGADPATSELDALRLSIGDTNAADPQLQDSELGYLLTLWGSVAAASTAAVRLLIAKYARLVDKSVGDLSLSYSQRLASYRALLGDLAASAASARVGIVVGGIHRARKSSVGADTGLVQPSFRRDDFSNARTEQDDLLGG